MHESDENRAVAKAMSEPFAGFDPGRPMYQQLQVCEALLCKVLVDGESLAQLMGRDPASVDHFVEARDVLELLGIIPESVYFDGKLFIEQPKDAAAALEMAAAHCVAHHERLVAEGVISK